MSSVYTPQQGTSAGGVIQSREDFPKTKRGDFEFWSTEIKQSLNMLKRYHRVADRIQQRFLDARTEGSVSTHIGRESPGGKFKLNLFYVNVRTQTDLLFGRVPRIDVSRRYMAANDDTGRVAALIMERLLNSDAVNNEDSYEAILRTCLEDRLVPGLAVARVRYEAEFEELTAAEAFPNDPNVTAISESITRVTSESAPLDYVHWRDVIWSWGRTWADIRWVGFRFFLTKDEAKERYGEELSKRMEYRTQKMLVDNKNNDVPDMPDNNDYWLKAEVWEIWDKEKREILEIHLGHDEVLKTREDVLKLKDFFPVPPFLMANPSSNLYRPTPDFHMAQDLYNEIDKLQTRIAIITEAVKVVGAYDASTPELQRMLKEGVENDLIPVDKWALFAEKGGLKGAIDWFPIEEVVNALVNLRQVRDETIQLLYQITGVADIMRGQLDNQYEGVGQTDTKVEFGSIRMTSLQEKYATFATNLMRLKAEIISKHFEPETIYTLAHCESMQEDPQLIQQAIALLKDPERANLAIRVKAESLANADYNRMRAERAEFLTGLSTFLQGAAPLIEMDKRVLPFLVEMLKWGMSGFRGSDEIEGVMDRALDAVLQPQEQQQQPDPETAKIQAQAMLEQTKTQGTLRVEELKHRNQLEQRQFDMQADIQTASSEHANVIEQTIADLRARIAEIEAKAEADMLVEEQTSATNAAQARETTEAEVAKDQINRDLDFADEVERTALRIREAKEVAKTTKPEKKDA